MEDINNCYLEQPEIYAKKLSKHKIACPHCGKKTIIPKEVDKVLCKYCRHFIFKDKVNEFRYRLNEAKFSIERKR